MCMHSYGIVPNEAWEIMCLCTVMVSFLMRLEKVCECTVMVSFLMRLGKLCVYTQLWYRS